MEVTKGSCVRVDTIFAIVTYNRFVISRVGDTSARGRDTKQLGCKEKLHRTNGRMLPESTRGLLHSD